MCETILPPESAPVPTAAGPVPDLETVRRACERATGRGWLTESAGEVLSCPLPGGYVCEVIGPAASGPGTWEVCVSHRQDRDGSCHSDAEAIAVRAGWTAGMTAARVGRIADRLIRAVPGPLRMVWGDADATDPDGTPAPVLYGHTAGAVVDAVRERYETAAAVTVSVDRDASGYGWWVSVTGPLSGDCRTVGVIRRAD
jgi:hypothetical protein